MSDVDFKKHPMSCRFFLMSLGSMSHVDFKKWSCHPAKLKGEEPHMILIYIQLHGVYLLSLAKSQ